MRRTVTLLAAVVAMISTPMPVRAADAAPGMIGIAPVAGDPAHPGASYLALNARPGQRLNEVALVTSTLDHAVDVEVYPVDGTTGLTSGALYKGHDAPLAETGSWIRVSQTSLRLAPRSQVRVPFTVTVPDGAVPGDHLGGVAVEQVAGPSDTPASGTIHVQTLVRAVAGVLVTLPGPAAFHFSITSARIEPSGVRQYATVVLHMGNDGRLYGKPRVTVDLLGDGYRRTVAHQLDTWLPGDILDFPFPWPDDLLPGAYSGTVTIEGAALVKPVVFHFGATVSEHLNASPTTTEPHTTIVTRPPVVIHVGPPLAVVVAAIAVGGTLLVSLLVLLALLLRRRRKALGPAV